MSQLLEPQTNIISRDKNLPHCATKMVDILLFASVRGNNLIWIKHYKSTNALKSCHCLTSVTSNYLIKIFSEPDWVPSTSEWALTQRHSNLQSGIHEGKLNKYIVEHNFLLKLIIIIWPEDESNYFHFISWRKIYDSAQQKSLWTVHILSCSCISYFFLWFVQLSHLPFRRKYTTWLSCFLEILTDIKTTSVYILNFLARFNINHDISFFRSDWKLLKHFTV